MGSGEHRASVYQEKAEAMDADRHDAVQAFQKAMSGYQGVIDGSAPSVAQQQMKMGMDQSIQSQMAMAASQRGRDPAAVQRQMMNNTAALQQQTAAQSAMLRAQEVEAARQAMAGGALARIGQTDANRNTMTAQGAQIGQAANPINQISGAVGKGAEAVTAIGKAVSDERQKTNIRDGSGAVRDFLEHISASKYSYKEGAKGKPGAGSGEYVSPMAQELEQSNLGQGMVMDTPNGKMVDYGKGFGAMLAAMADTHQRLKRIEAGMGKKPAEKAKPEGKKDA